MRAARLSAWRDPLEIVSVADPAPPGVAVVTDFAG